MNKTFFISILFATFFFFSCSSNLENEIQSNDDYIEVSFNLHGDFLNTSEKPMSKSSDTNKIYYYFRVEDNNWVHTGSHQANLGHYGVFDDLNNAKIRLKRGNSYTVYATALKEYSDKVDIEKLSKIECISGDKYIIYNCFSKYLVGYAMGDNLDMTGMTDSPLYTDKNIDRYFNKKNVIVKSNEPIDIELYRYSYAIKAEIDTPTTGYVVLSCEQPKFKYTVSSNDAHLSCSQIYSIGETVQKDISIKLEYFDANGKSTGVTNKDITVKANVETTIRVNIGQHNTENRFQVSFDKSPMKKEEINL